MVDWSNIPDIAAVALLTLAFLSVARRRPTSFSGVWLLGWMMIVVHFASFMFLDAPGAFGIMAEVLGTSSLAWAGILFMWASVPFRSEASSNWMLIALLVATTCYIAVLSFAPAGHWTLTLAALLVGMLPLAASLLDIRKLGHPQRLASVVLYILLCNFLLWVQDLPDKGPSLAINAVLFTVYFGCCIHFWFAYNRATAGAFITVLGFLAWANVFTISPILFTFFPKVHLQDEVWNLPKYVVAVGMILILLEDQIEHNKFLALHDELTGLPNRRLFQDRLAIALERARRTGTQTALLVIDLDRFKQVNDTAGHHIGDELLKHVSQLFLGRVRRIDTVARTGGDEFSIILEEPTNWTDAQNVAQTLSQLLNPPIVLEGISLLIGASVGIAVFPEDAQDVESLCIAADLRMYTNKRAARKREECQGAATSLSQVFSSRGNGPGMQLAE